MKDLEARSRTSGKGCTDGRRETDTGRPAEAVRAR